MAQSYISMTSPEREADCSRPSSSNSTQLLRQTRGFINVPPTPHRKSTQKREFPSQYHLNNTSLGVSTCPQSVTHRSRSYSTRRPPRAQSYQRRRDNSVSRRNDSRQPLSNPSSMQVSQEEIIQNIRDIIGTYSNDVLEKHEIMIAEHHSLLDLIDLNDESRKLKEASIKELSDQRQTFTDYMEQYCKMFSNKQSDPQTTLGALNREMQRLENRLPIYGRRQDLIEAITFNRVVILKADTGSGKSTQLVQYLYDANFAKKGQIVCAQPRRLAARTLASRVAEEFGCNLGEEVGYCVGTSRSSVSEQTRIRFVTDAVLLNEYHDDRLLSAYSVVIIDEAHERRINTDVLLGVMKVCLQERRDIKLIVMSATLNEDLLRQYYEDAHFVHVSCRTFPIQDEYAHEDPDDYVDAAIAKTLEIHSSEKTGDILVFLTGPDEINRAIEEMKKKIKSPNSALVLPLHGKLSDDETQQVFEPAGDEQRKIIFATNIAETSITIDGIRYVIDSGMVKEVMWDSKRNMRALKTDYTTQSSIKQRRGRVGRTSPGTCYYLYTYETYSTLDTCARAEILCVQPSVAVLKLKYLGITDVLSFEWLEAPDARSIENAVNSLIKLQALDSQTGKITELGQSMARLDIDPMLSAMILAGQKHDCLSYVLAIAGMLNVLPNLWWRGKCDESKLKGHRVRAEHSSDDNVGGDHIALLRIYLQWHGMNNNVKSQRDWCVNNAISVKSMKMAENFVKDIVYLINPKYRLDFGSLNKDLIKRIVQCVYAGYSQQLAVSNESIRTGYLIMNGSLGTFARVHHSSTLTFVHQPPKYIIYHDILTINEANYLTAICPIDMNWIDGSVVECNLSSYVFKNIGPALILSVVGKKCQNIPFLNDAFRIYIDADYQSAAITIWGESENIRNAQQYIQERLNYERQKLAHEIHEFQVIGSTRILLGTGGRIKSIMIEQEYVRVLITNLSESIQETEIRGLCKTCRGVQDVSIVQSNRSGSSALVTFDTYTNAERAVTNLARTIWNKREIRVCPSYIRTSVHASRQNCTLKAQWYMTTSKCAGHIVYSQIEAAQKAKTFLQNEKKYVSRIIGNDKNVRIRCRWAVAPHAGKGFVNFETDKAAYQALNVHIPFRCRRKVDDKKSTALFLQNVPLTIDEDDLRRVFQNCTSAKLLAQHTRTKETQPSEIEDTLCRLFGVCQSFQPELIFVRSNPRSVYAEADIQFFDGQEALSIVESMNDKPNPNITGKLRLSIFEQQTKRPTSRKDKNQFNDDRENNFTIRISRLPLDVDEEALTQDLNQNNLGDYLKRVVVFRNNLVSQPSGASSTEIINENRRNLTRLRALFENRDRFRSVPDIHIPPATQDGRVAAYILFNDPRDVTTAMDMYASSRDPELLKFGEFKIHLVPIIDHNIEMNSELASAIPTKIRQAIDAIKNDPKLANIIIVPKSALKNQKEISRIAIRGNNILQIYKARAVFDDLMKGIIYKFEPPSADSIIFSVTGKKFLQELQSRTKTYIWWHWKTRCLRIFGEDSASHNACQELDTYIYKACSRNEHTVSITIPNNVMRQCMQKQNNIQDLADSEVLVKTDVVKRLILVQGKKESVLQCEEKVRSLLDKLALLSHNTNTTTTSSMITVSRNVNDQCSICMCLPDAPYSLQICGHKHCRMCLISHFENHFDGISTSAAPSLCCPEKSCNKACCIRDIISILGHQRMDIFVKMIYHSYVVSNKYDLVPCIRDECEQVYRKSKNSETYFCDQCVESYCVPCKIEYHFGFTCEEYQKLQKENNSMNSTEEGSNKSLYKACPQCGKRIAKKDDNNALKCSYCFAVFCYLCSTTIKGDVSFHYGIEDSLCYARYFDWDANSN